MRVHVQRSRHLRVSEHHRDPRDRPAGLKREQRIGFLGGPSVDLATLALVATGNTADDPLYARERVSVEVPKLDLEV
jgi:hypothetical protein